jgi:hypothetical protein
MRTLLAILAAPFRIAGWVLDMLVYDGMRYETSEQRVAAREARKRVERHGSE